MAWTYITPKHYPITEGLAVVGDDWRIKIPVFQADRTTDFVFTGWNFLGQVRKRKSGTLVITFDTYDLTAEFVDNDLFLIADKDQTVSLTPGIYEWDGQFQDPYGFRRTLILKSPFIISEQITL